MKLIILSVTLVTGVISGVTPPLEGNSCTMYNTDINYYFYNTQNPKIPIKVPTANYAAIKNTHYNKAVQTIILIHGGGGNSSGPLITTVRDTIFTKAKKNINLIALDWGPLQKRYDKVTYKACLPIFAKMVQAFLVAMENNFGLKLRDLTIVGHSLAGKIMGAIGPQMMGQIQNFVVLEADSVAKTAAKYVQYIYTSSSSKGQVYGHVDYYANGGPNQPHCTDWHCNHWRVIDYYAESLISDKFIGRKCDTYAHYEAGKCKNNALGRFGGFTLDTKANGIYFFETNQNAPWAKGNIGK